MSAQEKYINPAQIYEYLSLNGNQVTTENTAEKPTFDNMPEKASYATQAQALARSAAAIYNAKGVEADDKQKALVALCETEQLDFPVSKFGLPPSAKRLMLADWWARKLVVRDRRAWECRRIAAGEVRKNKSLYCSDWAVTNWRAMKKKNAEFLQDMFVFNDDAFVASLANIAKHSLANPAVRRAELMVRLRGFEEYAIEKGHAATFITITCPSKYHAASGKYNGASPKEAQEYLCNVWARVRAKLAREKVDFYGFRVAEPHNDGCPHWHAILFCERQELAQVESVIRDYSLKEDGNEAGAQRRRFTRERIKMSNGEDGFKGGAVAYIAKYISKNIDGRKEDGTSVGEAVDRNGDVVSSDAIVTAERVLAWASMWGIRQFQQVGGERIGPYRELRRVRESITANAVLEVARAAADVGNFCLYLQAVERTKEGVWPLKVCEFEKHYDAGDMKAAAAALNQFGEPVRKVVGVRSDGTEIVTRRDDWRCMTEAAIHACYDEACELGDAVDFWVDVVEFVNLYRVEKAADFGGSWSSVNNCTGVGHCG